SRGARCGTRMGTDLDMIPVIEMTWEGWVTLYPTTRVVSSETGFLRDYNAYPYGNYDEPDNASLLFPMPRVDTRRPPKEHVADGSGLDLYRVVAAARPDLVHRRVFMTGDVLGSDIATFLRETQALHLSKPFEMSDLLSTLERAAGSEPALVGAVGPAG
ncbi:MAG TPA: DUF3179 domain-containing (seleno)protein, partial [Gemmatimonadales bacterium]|nr:DUF3179 domain-containing (seleno)protein [Gemmatimonadales bacterium]